MRRRKLFNRRGKAAVAPGGYGVITPRGHRRIYDSDTHRLVMEHDYVWREYHGNIPRGYIIHHRDGNKLNNNPSNLQLMKNDVHSYKHKSYRFTSNGFGKKK
jgi:hypothetical protein